jgi:serine/threonine protein kinase
MSTEEAESLASFLQPMLDFDPEKRAKAGDMLKNPWLTQTHSSSEPHAAVRSGLEEPRGSTILPQSTPMTGSDGARRGHIVGEPPVGTGQASPGPAPVAPKSGSGLQWSASDSSAPTSLSSQRVGSTASAAEPEESAAGAASVPDGGSSRSPMRQVTQFLGSMSFHSSGQTSAAGSQQSPPSAPSASDATSGGSSRRLVNQRLTPA